jgi:hypothetical protein
MRSNFRHDEPVTVFTALAAWVVLSVPISLGLALLLRRRGIRHEEASQVTPPSVRLPQ